MQKVILLALFVASVFAGFSVNIEGKSIDDNQYVIKKVNGKNQVQQAPPQKDGDNVFTFTPKINDEDVRSVFDTTVGQNWQYVADAAPKIQGKETVSAAFSRNTLVNAEPRKLQTVVIEGQKFSDVEVQASSSKAATDNEDFTSAATTGFALNRDEESNFFKTIKDSNVKLERQGFSFAVSEKVNQIFFGEPQEFFASDDLETIDASSGAWNSWAVPVVNGSIKLRDQNDLSYDGPVRAVFDSTTRYIWAQDKLVSSIVNILNSRGLNCQDVNPDAPVGLYNCSEGDFPALTLQFAKSSKKGAKDSKTYELKDYTQATENGRRRLLIRESARYQNDAKSAEVPPLSSKSNEHEIVLGTVFLQNVYTYFDVENDTVQLSQAFQVEPSNSNVDSTWRGWLLVLGTLATVGALAALISMIDKVPFNGVTSKTGNVSAAAPGQQVVYQSSAAAPAPVLYQSYAPVVQQVPVQAQTYVQYAQPAVQQLSPTRIYQTQYVPQ